MYMIQCMYIDIKKGQFTITYQQTKNIDLKNTFKKLPNFESYDGV